jgi:hypothetical protein
MKAMRTTAIFAVALLSACATTSLSGTPLESEFTGTWNGTATFALTGRSPVPYTLHLILDVSGSTVSVANVCPGIVQHESMRQSSMRLPTESARTQSSSLSATGSGASASWSGTLECPRVELTGCPSLAVSYTNATMTLTGTNQLTFVAMGNAEGCGTTYPVVLTFVGAK